jgi:uncharacterized membrane protein (Fun14 family)
LLAESRARIHGSGSASCLYRYKKKVSAMFTAIVIGVVIGVAIGYATRKK